MRIVKIQVIALMEINSKCQKEMNGILLETLPVRDYILEAYILALIASGIPLRLLTIHNDFHSS